MMVTWADFLPRPAHGVRFRRYLGGEGAEAEAERALAERRIVAEDGHRRLVDGEQAADALLQLPVREGAPRPRPRCAFFISTRDK